MSWKLHPIRALTENLLSIVVEEAEVVEFGNFLPSVRFSYYFCISFFQYNSFDGFDVKTNLTMNESNNEG
jgi:hypothetical protein